MTDGATAAAELNRAIGADTLALQSMVLEANRVMQRLWKAGCKVEVWASPAPEKPVGPGSPPPPELQINVWFNVAKALAQP